jgi:cell division protein FtsQ
MTFLKKLRKYRRIFYLLGAISAIILSFIMRSNYRNAICADIVVVVIDSSQNKYVSRSTIVEHLALYENEIVGNRFKNIDLADLKDNISNIQFIKEIDLYRVENEKIEIRLTQRNPIVRVYDIENNSFYIDEEGYFLPISKHYASYVPIFNGSIMPLDSMTFVNNFNVFDIGLDSEIYMDIFKLSHILRDNDFSRYVIDQVYVAENQEFEMISKIGNFLIIFGSSQDALIKLRNLEAYIRNGAPQLGWERYSAINLKYTNQIVCIKK